MVNKTAIAVHGGAGEDSAFVRANLEEYREGLKSAVEYGNQVLLDGGTAIEAVQEAVKVLEDHPHFNAGRGSALNREGDVEMDAAIMDGSTLKAGAVSMVRNVKNPIELARAVMNYTKHVYIAGEGALKIAKIRGLQMCPDDYFIVERQRQELLEEITRELPKKHTGTVGAVALDKFGNLAAATSTGGIVNSLHGRVGDSCIIGAGCYANNENVAVSCTGEGELIITGTVAHKIAMLVELKQYSIQAACDFVVRNLEKPFLGDLGVISVDRNGDLGIAFNSERMHRAWIDRNGNLEVKIYQCPPKG
jgi:L-asparaginase / beta-aspartyl-peptidase